MATTKTTKKPAAKRPAVVREARDAAQETTNAIIAALEAGTVPWHKEWHSNDGDMPTSLATGKQYRGSNIVNLWLAMQINGWSSPYFGTYNEMAERAGMVKVEFKNGGSKYLSPRLEDGTVDPTPRGVRKGEKGNLIIRWIFKEARATDPDTGKPLSKRDGSPLMKRIVIPMVWHVFNAEQCEFPEGCKGVPATPERTHVDTIAAAEALVGEYLNDGPSLHYGSTQAFYRPPTDEVYMPHIDNFESAEGFYSTLYHELTHSTGHESREAREGIAKGTFGKFGDQVYSFEELVAELGAAMLCAIAGIPQEATLDNSAAYIAHWLKALKDDKKLIIKAASKAQKAVDRILGQSVAADDKEQTEAAEEVSA